MRIELRNDQTVFDLTVEQRSKLKKALTFDNPAYKNAKKYGRSRYISIPKTLEYYKEFSYPWRDGERRKAITVPAGVDVGKILGVPISHSSISDYRVPMDVLENRVHFPPFNLTLRDDQRKAAVAYLDHCNDYAGPRLVQLPTGKGKSILALYVAYILEQRTLILVHKDDLVVGWKKDIELCFPGMKPGLIKAQSRTIGKYVTIATVQTLSRMTDEERNNYLDQFGFVVQDECHHIGINIFNVIGQFNARYKMGLTATPKRTDGLDHVFDIFLGGLCYKHVVTEDDEDISQVAVNYIDAPAKYKPFVFNGQVFNYYDYSPGELPDKIQFVEELSGDKRPRIPFLEIDRQVVSDPATVEKVCKHINIYHKRGYSVLVLFTQKEHVRLYRDFLETLMPEDDIQCYYGDAAQSSQEMMERAESTRALVTLGTYAKTTEGTNVKRWEVLYMVSSCNNAKNIEQATGRIRRRLEGKLDPVIVNVVRYPHCYSLRGHANTYSKTFKELGYIVPDTEKKRPLFTRGYR